MSKKAKLDAVAKLAKDLEPFVVEELKNDEKERGDRLEAMVDRMAETIVTKDADLVLLRKAAQEVLESHGSNLAITSWMRQKDSLQKLREVLDNLA